MRLIDADALEKTGIPFAMHGGATFIALGSVRTAPTIEADPVRHGRWVMTLYTTTSKRGRVISNKRFACSECGYGNGRKQNNYCPNCGAKMDGGTDDER